MGRTDTRVHDAYGMFIRDKCRMYVYEGRMRGKYEETGALLDAVFREGYGVRGSGRDRRRPCLRGTTLDLRFELAALLAKIVVFELHRERKLNERLRGGRKRA